MGIFVVLDTCGFGRLGKQRRQFHGQVRLQLMTGEKFSIYAVSTPKVSEISYISDSNLTRVRKPFIWKKISPILAKKWLESSHMEKISLFRGRNLIYTENQTLFWLEKLTYENIYHRSGFHCIIAAGG